MKMKKTTLSLTITLTSSFVLSLIILSLLVSAVPAVWCGYADIEGTYASSGAVIEAFVNNGTTAAGITRVGDYGINETGFYQIYVEGHDGDNVTFKVYGVATNASVQTWHQGFNCPPFLNISINKTANGGSCSYSAACSGNYCCSGATEYTDGSGTGTCQSTACTAAAGGAAAGTAGGVETAIGGGAIAAGITETQTVASVSTGSTANFVFTKLESIGITDIALTVNADKKDVKLIVSETSKPALASIAISAKDGSIFKYIKITKLGISDSEISGVKIRFKVPKSWVLTNNIELSTITMKHLKLTEWEELSTTMRASDSNYYYFEASSPSLSTFVIVGRKKAAATPPPQTPTPEKTTETPLPTPVETPTQEATPAVPTPAKPVNKLLVFLIIIGIVALIAVVLYIQLAKKKQYRF